MSGPGTAGHGGPAYRPDIDGLRAIAVLSVVAFHLSRRGLPGGFLGVDVFFVLSGYLITSILWREAIAGDFSIARFYERRVRRIVPALLVVLAVTTIASAALLLPVDLVGYGRSVFATLGFVANVYFWRDSDYFARGAEEKPLLHMWSLGVEEQFYILFPFLIWLLARYRRRWAAGVILALVVGSLALQVFAVRIGGATPAFYMLPTRAWELGAGAFAAISAFGAGVGSRIRAALNVVALLLVAVGIASPEAMLPAQLPNALFVVVGTAIILRLGGIGGGPAARLLSLPAMVKVGLISYSLYLWHWPLIVLPEYYLARDLTSAEMAGLVVLMLVCAELSSRYVERPTRGRAMPVRRLLLLCGFGVLAVSAAAAALIAGHGFPARLSPAAARINAAVGTEYRCPVSRYLAVGYARGCEMALPSRNPADADVALIGNSHALMYAPLVERLLVARGLHGVLINANSCLPSASINFDAACARTAGGYIDAAAKLARVRVVIVALNWTIGEQKLRTIDGALAPAQGVAGFVAAIEPTISRLEQAGKRVVVVGPIAVPGFDVASFTSRDLAFGRTPRHPLAGDAALFRARMAPVFAAFGARRDIVLLRPDLAICGARRCPYIEGGRSLFADDNHLAVAALGYLDAAFAQALDRAMTDRGSGGGNRVRRTR